MNGTASHSSGNHWSKTLFHETNCHDSIPWFPWRRHQMETFSALLAICAGGIHQCPVNSPHNLRPVTRSFGLFFDLRLNINGWVNNREAGDLKHNRAHYDVIVMGKVFEIRIACLKFADQLEVCSFFVGMFIFSQIWFHLHLYVLGATYVYHPKSDSTSRHCVELICWPGLTAQTSPFKAK